MANFQFSYVYGNLRSDENTLAMTMQKTIFVEANITNVSVMYQPHRPYGFQGDDFVLDFSYFFLISFLFFFFFFFFWLPCNLAALSKFIYLVRDY